MRKVQKTLRQFFFVFSLMCSLLFMVMLIFSFVKMDDAVKPLSFMFLASLLNAFLMYDFDD